MLVAECECGAEVPFVVEDSSTGPFDEACEKCGRVYRLRVKRVGGPG